ncbi:MAG: hypothetical protein JWO06_430 [Bacteroidota bacterium]|nr:hypothetical protein [Bacteroidota bacterium]
MKKIFSIVFLLAFTASLFAANGIVVTQKYAGVAEKGSVTVTWYVTATQCKMKMDFQSADVTSTTWFIPDLSTGNLLTYGEGPVPAKVSKTYYSIPAKSIQSNLNVSRVSVNRTGETKTLMGMLCEKVIVKTNKTITEMWVTKDFKADYYKYYAFFQSSYELMGLSEESLQGFPLESVTKDLTGNVITSLNLTSAKSSDLTSADFNVPADYKAADLKK